jgi:TolB-like protein
MLFRMGVNLGDVILVDDDIYGDGVNIAARLETLASPGGICISGTVYDQLAGKINQDIKDMGEQSLRNIEDPIRTYKILATGTEPALLGNLPSATVVSDLGFGAPERPSIAILPFKNLSGDPDQNFLAEGLRLGIVSSLVQLSGIFLISTDAVNGYKDQEGLALQAGREVAAGYILEGSVQQVGQTLRATLHLTDVDTNEIIWSERYDGKVDDLFKVQDEITQEVLISLNVKLVAGEKGRVWFDGITNPQAREFYHRGISHVYLGTKDDNLAALRQMLEFYRVQPDTDHGPSFIALIHLTNAIFGWSESESRSLDEASRWAEVAVKYEKNSGIGYIVNGHLKLLQGQHDEALESCERAIGIRPSCSFTHGILASVQNFCGDSPIAVQHAREALLIERVYPPWIVNVLAAAYRDSGKVQLSIPAAQEALRLEPQQNEARLILCSGYVFADSNKDARQIARDVLAVDPTFNVSTYAEKQPYKHRETLEQIVEALHAAGLPE